MYELNLLAPAMYYAGVRLHPTVWNIDGLANRAKHLVLHGFSPECHQELDISRGDTFAPMWFQILDQWATSPSLDLGSVVQSEQYISSHGRFLHDITIDERSPIQRRSSTFHLGQKALRTSNVRASAALSAIVSHDDIIIYNAVDMVCGTRMLIQGANPVEIQE